MSIKTLIDGTTYIKASAHNWEGDKTIKGVCHVYRKIDGVRALRLKNNSIVSRNSKPLYNLNHLEFRDAEIFYKDWNTTVSLVRTQTLKVVTQEMVYNLLDDHIDKRLYLGRAVNPSNENLANLMHKRLALGDEGLVVRHKNKQGQMVWWKVVPYKYADLKITGFKEGTGAMKGMLGSFKTEQGCVGSGFDIPQRVDFWGKRHQMIGRIIQVKYREITDDGKLRFPSFERIRFDKDEESLD
ncbi:MAG: hypothetical protein EKE20_14635 [Candidatus Symbiopectobacterium sp. Dall1.0]|nr:hypothetical protein [Candidatus Symbiopectobacterium sp. Dall1.0]